MGSLFSFDAPIVAYALCVAALLGLVMGSFINCWAWRYMNGESVLKGRSHCTTCGHVLGLADLVPVFSWLFSGGKCRYCGERVSARYPATELVCALVFVGIVAVYGFSLQTVELLVFAGVLLFLSLTDLDDYLIPNGCILTAIAVRVVYLAISWAMGTTGVDELVYYLASGLGVGLALLLIVFIADLMFGRDSMGGGDLKLYCVAGFYFGWQQCLLLVIISCVIGIAVAIIGDRRSKSRELASESQDEPVVEPLLGEQPPGEPEAELPLDERLQNKLADMPGSGEIPSNESKSVLKSVIPFGPSIAASCVIVMLAGEPMINWYLNLLG